MAGPTNERLEEELAILQSIYTADEVSLNQTNRNDGETKVVMTVHPATAGEAQLQYVCLMLHVTLPASYPDESPDIEIRNPRGLSEQEVEGLRATLLEYLKEERGAPVLMQIFQIAQDTLTETNIPHGACSICLCEFKEASNDLFKTDCYHYFHLGCIVKYKSHWLRETATEVRDLPAYLATPQVQFVCPECREPIHVPDTKMEEQLEESFEYVVSKEMRSLQEEWKERYERQLAAGGIIDLEKEKEKHRLPPTPIALEIEGEERSALTPERNSEVGSKGRLPPQSGTAELKSSQDDNETGASMRTTSSHRGRGGHSKNTHKRSTGYYRDKHQRPHQQRTNYPTATDERANQRTTRGPPRSYSDQNHAKTKPQIDTEKAVNNTDSPSIVTSNDLGSATGVAGDKQRSNSHSNHQSRACQSANRRQRFTNKEVNSTGLADTAIKDTSHQGCATSNSDMKIKPLREHKSHQPLHPSSTHSEYKPDHETRLCQGGERTVPQNNDRSQSKDPCRKHVRRTAADGNHTAHSADLPTEGGRTIPGDRDIPQHTDFSKSKHLNDTFSHRGGYRGSHRGSHRGNRGRGCERSFYSNKTRGDSHGARTDGVNIKGTGSKPRTVNTPTQALPLSVEQ